MAKKVYEEAKIAAIAGKIREKTGGKTTYKTSEMPSGIDEVFEAGKNKFWNEFTNNGERTNYNYAFYNWGSEYIRPTRKIIPTDNASARSTFWKCPNLKKIEAAYFDFSQKNKGTSNATGYSYTFYNCNKLEEIEDIGIKADYAFDHAFECGKLRTIARIGTDENTKFTGAFDYANSLESVTFEGVIGQNLTIRWSSKLSIASMKSIISCLKNYSGTDKEYTYTLTFSENMWARLEADSTAPDGNTWRDYVNTLGWNA